VDATGAPIVPSVHHPEQAGWLQVTYGKPRSLQDPIIILGHVDGDGKEGVFFHLKNIKVGDQILLAMQDSTVRTYTVTRVQQIRKSKFPAAAVYGQTPGPEIRLITCGGTLDRAAHNYLDSLIAYGSLTN
jgi:LPXTG-site transpeptidase (sortase) family protein